jgi:hypothetical protein
MTARDATLRSGAAASAPWWVAVFAPLAKAAAAQSRPVFELHAKAEMAP